MKNQSALIELLSTMFSDGELNNFIQELEDHCDTPIAKFIPNTGALSERISELIGACERRGFLDEFRTILYQQRPRRSAEVEEIFDAQGEEDTPEPTPQAEEQTDTAVMETITLLIEKPLSDEESQRILKWMRNKIKGFSPESFRFSPNYKARLELKLPIDQVTEIERQIEFRLTDAQKKSSEDTIRVRAYDRIGRRLRKANRSTKAEMAWQLVNRSTIHRPSDKELNEMLRPCIERKQMIQTGFGDTEELDYIVNLRKSLSTFDRHRLANAMMDTIVRFYEENPDERPLQFATWKKGNIRLCPPEAISSCEFA